MSARLVSIVVPVLNEEDIVDRLYTEVCAALDGTPFELVYVDDGSRDRTGERIQAQQERDPRVVLVVLSRNWGHQAAITAGLSAARGEAVILMDGDLQDPPSVLPDMVAAWRHGAQVVVARRRSRAERGIRRLLFASFYRVLGFLSDYPIPLDAGIFGLLDRQAVDAILRLQESNRYLPGLRAWVGYRTEIVLYDRAERAAGDAKQSFTRLLKYGFDAIFSFSYKPLRMSLVVGTLVAALSLLYGTFLLLLRLTGHGMFGIPVVDGYTTTIVAILFLGGVQLFSVGVLGEYIARIYDEVKRRPLFLVQAVHRVEP